MGARLLADREVIPQAMKLNPAFFQNGLHRTCSMRRRRARTCRRRWTRSTATSRERAATLFEPVLEHLREVGEARSATEIEDYFKRNFNVEGVTTACEYLADQGLIGKASTPVQLTKRSNVVVQELAFVHLGEAPDEF